MLVALWCAGMGARGSSSGSAVGAQARAMDGAPMQAVHAATHAGHGPAAPDVLHDGGDHRGDGPDAPSAAHAGASCAAMSGHCLDGIAGPQAAASRIMAERLGYRLALIPAALGVTPEAQDPPPRA